MNPRTSKMVEAIYQEECVIQNVRSHSVTSLYLKPQRLTGLIDSQPHRPSIW